MATPIMDREPEPILASWKISDVLKQYPALLDELVALHPAFEQLRNPLKRRIQARLVTVARAAEIAGLEPAAVVRSLNAAIGVTTPVAAPQASLAEPAVAPAWLAEAHVAVELDVRPRLRRGEEPFSAIMQAIERVPEGQIMRLRATFDPLPLYDVLAKRGFTGWSRQLGAEDWEVSFMNEGRPRRESSAPSMTPEERALDWDAPSQSVTIDVSELVPPEPMIKILEALERLPPGETLLVHHVRRPVHLYPRLDELGCQYDTREPEPGRVELLIRKPPATPEART